MHGNASPAASQLRTQAALKCRRDPGDLPSPIGVRGPQKVRIDLTTVEVQGQLADKTTYKFWTFNKKVPGPMVRVRVGDTVEVHLKNDAGSVMTHSVDFHAATGPGGAYRARTMARSTSRRPLDRPMICCTTRARIAVRARKTKPSV